MYTDSVHFYPQRFGKCPKWATIFFLFFRTKQFSNNFLWCCWTPGNVFQLRQHARLCFSDAVLEVICKKDEGVTMLTKQVSTSSTFATIQKLIVIERLCSLGDKCKPNACNRAFPNYTCEEAWDNVPLLTLPIHQAQHISSYQSWQQVELCQNPWLEVLFYDRNAVGDRSLDLNCTNHVQSNNNAAQRKQHPYHTHINKNLQSFCIWREW